MIKPFLIAALVLLINLSQPAPALALTVDDVAKAEARVRQLGDDTIIFLEKQGLSTAEQKAQFRELFSNYFAGDRIARFVLGRYARSATPEQLEQFKDLFQRLLIEIYASRLSEFKSQSLTLKGAALDNSKRFVFVDGAIQDPRTGNMAAVQWRLVDDGGVLRIMDLTVEGISMGLSLRSEYAGLLEKQGGNIDALLNTMQAKLTDITNGAAKPQP